MAICPTVPRQHRLVVDKRITSNGGNDIWTGAAASRIQNDTAGPLTITVNGNLNAGIILSGGGTNATFIKNGIGNLRLSNPGNTANITATDGFLFSSDLSTNVGAGAFGTLGTGTITLDTTGPVY